MDERVYKVYKYVFPNNKVYIGVTSTSFEQRLKAGYGHNMNLKRAIKHFGWRSVKKIVIKDNLPKEEAFQLEKTEIARYRAAEEEFGYNVSYGGLSTFQGLKHTEEYKKKMSESRKGIVYSPITLERMKAAHAKERKPVWRIADNGEKVLFDSLGEAAQIVQGYRSNIARACKEKKKYKGYHWEMINKGGDLR